MPRRKKKKLTERLSAWKEEQKTDKQPSQQDDKQAEVESVQEVESGVQEPAEMLMEVEETIPLKNALEIKTVGRLCAEHTADGIHQGAEPSMRN
ncbi:uncharacterized protein LOC144921485 isoform X1 [Branchiostoma floridae x Branchiostoma belcheri]